MNLLSIFVSQRFVCGGGRCLVTSACKFLCSEIGFWRFKKVGNDVFVCCFLPAGYLSDSVRVLCDSHNWVLVSLAVPEPTWDESVTWLVKLEGFLLYLHLKTRYQVCHVNTCEFCVHCGTKHLIHCDLVFCLAGWAQERANYWRAPWWCGTSTSACTGTIKPRTYHWASRWWCQAWYMGLQCFAGFSFFACRIFFCFLFFIWPLLYVKRNDHRLCLTMCLLWIFSPSHGWLKLSTEIVLACQWLSCHDNREL